MSSTVLIVGADPLLRGVLSDALRAVGMHPLGIVEPCGAGGLIRSSTPDLVLVDLAPPGEDAVKLLRDLRADPMLGRTPVVLLGGDGGTAQRVAVLQAGADDVIAKPFDLDELLARIDAHLRRSRREQGLNPLSRLPGHAVVEQTVQVRLEHQQPFTLHYIDLDHFKAYNDHYSFVQGDRLIVGLAGLVVETSREFGGGLPVAHIGGDDFLMLVADPALASVAATRLIAEFDARLSEFYEPEDFARGYVEVLDRARQLARVPLVSLSIAIVRYRGEPGVHWGALAARAGEMKQAVKRREGHGYLIDRRSFDAGTTVDTATTTPVPG
jgi:DNA-binding response OmpR family regulator